MTKRSKKTNKIKKIGLDPVRKSKETDPIMLTKLSIRYSRPIQVFLKLLFQMGRRDILLALIIARPLGMRIEGAERAFGGEVVRWNSFLFAWGKGTEKKLNGVKLHFFVDGGRERLQFRRSV